MLTTKTKAFVLCRNSTSAIFFFYCYVWSLIITVLVDETIGYVLSELRDRDLPYTAVYTGLKPSHVSSVTIYYKLQW